MVPGPGDFLRPREGLWACYGALRAVHRAWWTVSTVNDPYGYLPARCATLLWRHCLELSVTEHLSDAIGRELEDPRGFLDGVEVLSLHAGSIHLEVPFVRPRPGL
jgi:hypothetical protein